MDIKRIPIPTSLYVANRKNRTSLRIAIGLMLMLLSAALTQEVTMQQNILKGKITDAYTGNPIAGAIIQLEGTETAVRSEKDGTYSITLPGNAQKLIITYSGYQTLTIIIDGRAEINVVLSQAYEDPAEWYF